MTVFFTSDLHLGHQNVIKMNDRPFKDVDEMNRTLIQNINARVSSRDTLWILGDVSYKITRDEAIALISKINCKDLHLVRGNHDKNWEGMDIFTEICDYKEIKAENGRRICLMHYPLASWNGMHREAMHLHGHCHFGPDYNRTMFLQGFQRYDVGVDANDYYPVTLEDIFAKRKEGVSEDFFFQASHHKIADLNGTFE